MSDRVSLLDELLAAIDTSEQRHEFETIRDRLEPYLQDRAGLVNLLLRVFSMPDVRKLVADGAPIAVPDADSQSHPGDHGPAMADRPAFVGHWTTFESPEALKYKGSDELLSVRSSIGKELGLKKIGIHHERLPPGRRTSYPHAESAEEEFVYVLSGNPDVWIDGVLYPLVVGDAVAFPSGTGICHTFINNSESEVELLVVGETDIPFAKIYYPLNERYASTRSDIWMDPPMRERGPHDGLPDARRAPF